MDRVESRGRVARTTEHEAHGARFSSYVSPSSGSAELCAWRLRVPADTTGTAHRVSREEVFLVLAGSPDLRLDERAERLGPGDVAFVPAGSRLAIDNPGAEPAELWVTTSVGLTAELADGTTMRPPWTR